MINNLLLAAAVSIPVTPLCAPVLAENIDSPKTIPALAAPAAFSAALSGGNTPPSMYLAVRSINNNIACRNTARAKYFEVGARDMSDSNSNSQWGTVGSMQAVVWCRDTQAIIAVAGGTGNSAEELRDTIANGF